MAELAQLLESYEEQIKAAPRVLIGFSGGLDSSVLLHAASALVEPERLLALHINHQLNETSDNWEVHCKEVAEELGCAFYSERIRLESDVGIEEHARQARYKVFERILGEKDLLLLGHHADDQVETFLFRLFRGSGVKGLAAIPPARSLGKGRILRPLLSRSKQELEKLAHASKIHWVEDPSNADSQFDRNFIRNELMLLVKDRWTEADTQVLHAVECLRETDELLSEIAMEDIAACDFRKESLGVSLCLTKLKDMSPLRKENLLRRFFYMQTNTQPNAERLRVITEELIGAAEDKQPCVQMLSSELRRFKDRLYLIPRISGLPESSAVIRKWDGEKPYALYPGVWSIEQLSGPDAKECRVAFRQGGERAKPIDRDRSQSLKKLMLEYDIEPWLRDWIPIIYLGDQIVGVGDRIPCSDFRFRMHWLIEGAD